MVSQAEGTYDERLKPSKMQYGDLQELFKVQEKMNRIREMQKEVEQQKQALVKSAKNVEKKPGRQILYPKPKLGKKSAKSEPEGSQKKKKAKKNQKVDKNQPSVASFFKKL